MAEPQDRLQAAQRLHDEALMRLAAELRANGAGSIPAILRAFDVPDAHADPVKHQRLRDRLRAALEMGLCVSGDGGT